MTALFDLYMRHAPSGRGADFWIRGDPMSLSIAGKTAIVTGAANGIGLAIARHFLDKGANVMFADMDEDRLEDEVGTLARAEGAVRMFAGDLREKLTIANLLSATMDAFDRVDILVNASRQMALSEPLCIGDDAVEQLLQQNLITSLRLTQRSEYTSVLQRNNGQFSGLMAAMRRQMAQLRPA